MYLLLCIFQIVLWVLYIGVLPCCSSSRYYYTTNNFELKNKDDEAWYRSPTFWSSATILLTLLILGLYCDAMFLGDEGTHFLTWNKDKFDGQQSDGGDQLVFYSLTSSFSPNYNVINHQWNKMSDVYDIHVDSNRVMNITEVDQFVTKYHCGSGERMYVVFGSVPWCSPTHTVNINCLHNSN